MAAMQILQLRQGKQQRLPVVNSDPNNNEILDYNEVLKTLMYHLQSQRADILCHERELVARRLFSTELYDKYVKITTAIQHFFTFKFINEYTPSNYRAAVSLLNNLNEYHSCLLHIYATNIPWWRLPRKGG